MEPIWQSRGKQLYTSLDYMNHLHKSNNFSHEIGSGLVLWQSLASGTELGLGAYWLNYNSWHNLRHHGLRLGAKFIWQDWHLTGNGFFRMSNAKKAKVGVNYHLYYRQVGKMVAGEQMVNGVDMIVGRSLWGMDINGTAYYYPNTGNNLQLLTKGVGVKVAIPLKNPIQKFTAAYLSFIASNMYDKHHKTLTTFGIRLTNPSQRYVIQKTDTDGATTHYNCIIIQQVPPPADTLNPWSSHGVEKFTASDECQCISSALHQANTNTSKHYGWNYNGLTGSVKARQTLQSFNFC